MHIRLFILGSLLTLALLIQAVITGVSWGLGRIVRSLTKPHVTQDSDFPNTYTLQLMQRLAQRFSYQDSLTALLDDSKVSAESVERNRALYEKILSAPEALELSKRKEPVELSHAPLQAFLKNDEASGWIKQVARHHQDLRLMELSEQYKNQVMQVCNSFTASQLVDLSVLTFVSSKTKVLNEDLTSLLKLDSALKRDFVRPFIRFANHPLLGRGDAVIRMMLLQLKESMTQGTSVNQLLLVNTVLEQLGVKLGKPLLELYLRAISLDAIIRAPLELYHNFGKLSAHERNLMASGIAELALMNRLVATLAPSGVKSPSPLASSPISSALEPLQCHPVYGKLCFLLTSNLPSRMTAISRLYLQSRLVRRQKVEEVST